MFTKTFAVAAIIGSTFAELTEEEIAKRWAKTKVPDVVSFKGEIGAKTSASSSCSGDFGDKGKFFVGITGRQGWTDDVIMGWGGALCGSTTDNQYTIDLIKTTSTTNADTGEVTETTETINTDQRFYCDYNIDKKGIVSRLDKKNKLDKKQYHKDEQIRLISIEKELMKSIKKVEDDAIKSDLIALDPVFMSPEGVKNEVNTLVEENETQVHTAFDTVTDAIMTGIDDIRNTQLDTTSLIEVDAADSADAIYSVLSEAIKSFDKDIKDPADDLLSGIKDTVDAGLAQMVLDLEAAFDGVDAALDEIDSKRNNSKSQTTADLDTVQNELNSDATIGSGKHMKKMSKKADKSLEKNMNANLNDIKQDAKKTLVEIKVALNTGYKQTANSLKSSVKKSLAQAKGEIKTLVNGSDILTDDEKTAFLDAVNVYADALNTLLSDDIDPNAAKNIDIGSFNKETNNAVNTQKKDFKIKTKEDKAAIDEATDVNAGKHGYNMPSSWDSSTEFVEGVSFDVLLTNVADSETASCTLTNHEVVENCPYGPIDDLQFWYLCSLQGKFYYGKEEYACEAQNQPSQLFCDADGNLTLPA